MREGFLNYATRFIAKNAQTLALARRFTLKQPVIRPNARGLAWKLADAQVAVNISSREARGKPTA